MMLRKWMLLTAFSAAFTHATMAMDYGWPADFDNEQPYQPSQISKIHLVEPGEEAYEDLKNAFKTNCENNAMKIAEILEYQMNELMLTQAGSDLFAEAARACGFAPLLESFMRAIEQELGNGNDAFRPRETSSHVEHIDVPRRKNRSDLALFLQSESTSPH
ncbi:MAG: hypothetical protein V4482_03280 [Pseudomonadota bacterium]